MQIVKSINTPGSRLITTNPPNWYKRNGLREGTYFLEAARKTGELEKEGFRAAHPLLRSGRIWQLTRAANRVVENGMDSVVVGQNKDLGILTPNEVAFAQGYALIYPTVPPEWRETPGEMLEYLTTETPRGFDGRGYFSHFTVILDGNKQVAGVITGAIIRVDEERTLVFNGYRVRREDLKGAGLGYMLMTSAIERSMLGIGKEAYYTFGEAGGPTEIASAKMTGRHAVLGIDYRQPDLSNRKGSVFVNCEQLTVMLGTRNDRERIPASEMQEIVRAVYEYYNLAGKRLAGFMENTFGELRNGVWRLNSSSDFEHQKR